MVLKLYGFAHSSNTQLVLILLKEFNVPYEFVLVDLAKGEQKTPEYLTKHPFGVVPFIDDDGFELYESRAIARYIVTKYGSGSTLIPTELKARALAEQVISMESSYFHPHAGTIFKEKVIAPRLGGQTDEARFQEAVRKIESTFDVYEAILGKQKYLAGNEVTLGDLAHLPLGKIVHSYAPEAFSKRSNVARWWSDLSARPSVQATEATVKESKF